MKKKTIIWTPLARARIEEWVEYWVRMLALEPVNTDIIFDESGHPDDGSGTVCMDIVSSFPYRAMTIRVYPCMATMSRRRVAQKTCHELMHYVVSPMRRYRLAEPQYFSDQEEVVVEQVSMNYENIVHQLHESKETVKKLTRALLKKNRKR